MQYQPVEFRTALNARQTPQPARHATRDTVWWDLLRANSSQESLQVRVANRAALSPHVQLQDARIAKRTTPFAQLATAGTASSRQERARAL